MVELVLGGELALGDGEAAFDLLGVVGPAADEPLAQRLPDGGAMNTWTASGSVSRTWRAPCTSISSTTGTPAVVRRSSSERSVP